MAERPVLSDKPFRNRILVPIKSSEPEDSEDTARLGLLNWLSISQNNVSSGATMKALIPKDLHTNLHDGMNVIVKRSPMLFPTQTTDANNLTELQATIYNHIFKGIKNAYSYFETSATTNFQWIKEVVPAIGENETIYNLVDKNSDNSVARIIVTHPETSLEQLIEGLDTFFEGNFKVDIVPTE